MKNSLDFRISEYICIIISNPERYLNYESPITITTSNTFKEALYMPKPRGLIITLAFGALIFTSCAGVKFEYNNLGYLKQQISELPPELLNSNLVQNEAGESLMSPPLKVGEFLIYMMVSQPLEGNSWLTLNVTPKSEGSVITIKQFTRGKLVLVNTLYLTYQNGFTESRVDKIIWDNRRFGDKHELISTEDKLGYSLLIATFLTIQ